MTPGVLQLVPDAIISCFFAGAADLWSEMLDKFAYKVTGIAGEGGVGGKGVTAAVAWSLVPANAFVEVKTAKLASTL